MRLLLAFLLLASTFSFSQTTKKVCFLGNSYTYYNDMPGMVAAMANADGNTLVKDQNTPGGHTLQGHSTNSTSLTKITANNWDYVVLQDQSQMPSFPWSQVSTDVLPYAEILSDSIRSANECAIPLFFNTWGRLAGDPQWDSINTFTKMNYRLANAYGHMADVNTGMRAPVGIGFEHIENDGGSPLTLAQLYNGDGSHPSVYGSYLAACIFYEIIFETTSQGNTHLPSGIIASEATYIQNVANHVVNDVDSIDVDFTDPFANFSYSINGLEVTFSNESEHAFEYSWDFGDSNNSTDENPVHTYSSNTSYNVVLTATNCGQSHDTTIVVNFTAENPTIEFESINVYPNPVNDQVYIQYTGQQVYGQLYSIQGEMMMPIILNESVEIHLIPGTYIVRIGELNRKIIVQ
jgi:hypothetical protein